MLLQRLQRLASTDVAAKTYLTQQHAQGPRMHHLLDAWQDEIQWTVAVLELLGALTLLDDSVCTSMIWAFAVGQHQRS